MAGAIYNCEEGWRKGESMSPLLQMSLVQYAGSLPPEQEDKRAAIMATVVAGHQLTGQEEHDILFRGLDQ